MLARTTELRADAAIDFVKTRWPTSTASEFISAEWICAAWEILPELGTPLLLLLQNAGRWAALALTETRDNSGAPVITNAGAPLGDEHDIVANDLVPSEAFALALECLGAQGRAVRLQALAPHGRLVRLVAERTPTWKLQREPAPTIITANANVNVASHSRRLRRLASRGSLQISIRQGATLTPLEGRDFVSRRLASWRCRTRIHELPAIERSAAFPSFLGHVVGGLAARGLAQLRVLELNGAPIAEDLMLGTEAEPILYMRSYNPDFAAYSPGRLLLEDLLLNPRVTRVRTGRGDEPYKLAAGAELEYVVDAVLTGQ